MLVPESAAGCSPGAQAEAAASRFESLSNRSGEPANEIGDTADAMFPFASIRLITYDLVV